MNLKRAKKLSQIIFVRLRNLFMFPLVFMRMVVSKDYRVIRNAKVFDEHYFTHGVGKKIILGDPVWEYLRRDVPDYRGKESGWWPQQSFVDPHPFFDIAFYVSKYFQEGLTGHPFSHYLAVGWKKGFAPGPFFDQGLYAQRYGWCVEDGNPLSHYVAFNSDTFLSLTHYFDAQWYLDRSPASLQKVKNNLITHYRQFGISEGKCPVPNFDPVFYNNYLKEKEITAHDPFSHFVTISDFGDNRPNEWFDPDYYIKGITNSLRRSDAYAHYLSKGVFEKKYINEEIARMKEKPVISIIVPVYNPNPHFLNNCIRSVLYQTYPHWELCLADDCSSRDGTVDILKKWAEKDPRINVVYLTKNRGISIATNTAAECAGGDYLGFLDNDDELTPDCLFHIVHVINEKRAEVIYTDEDLIGEDGRRFSIFRKPGFNPELLLSHNYITHFTLISRALFEKVGRLNPEYDGAQDYDLILKTSERAESVVHINKVLYHWRASQSSTSINHDQKTYANEAGRKVLQNGLDRRGVEGFAETTELNFFYRIEFKPNKQTSVSIIIWIDNFSRKVLENISTQIKKTIFANCIIIIVFRESVPGFGGKEYIANFYNSKNIVTYPVPDDFDKASALNRAALSTESDFLVFIDRNMKIRSGNWIEQLLGPFGLGSIGMVCGRLLINNSDGVSFTVPDNSITSAEYFHDFLTLSTRHANGVHCLQQVPCCSSEMTMIKTSLFKELGGFDEERFPHLFEMVDLSFRAAESGQRLLYTPYAEADVDKTAWMSRNGSFGEVDLNHEMIRFQNKWRAKLQLYDTFYNNKIVGDAGIEERQFFCWLTGEQL